jgi:hypothetical protein
LLPIIGTRFLSGVSPVTVKWVLLLCVYTPMVTEMGSACPGGACLPAEFSGLLPVLASGVCFRLPGMQASGAITFGILPYCHCATGRQFCQAEFRHRAAPAVLAGLVSHAAGKLGVTTGASAHDGAVSGFDGRRVLRLHFLHGLPYGLHLSIEIGAGIADAKVQAQAGTLEQAQVPVQALGDDSMRFLACKSN